MGYRVLIDENTSPRVAELLSRADHDAVHVCDVLDSGATDDEIVHFASEQGRIVLTHDDDFLLPDRAEPVSILYYSADRIGADEIVDRVEEISRLVPDQRDLPSITNLGSWN